MAVFCNDPLVSNMYTNQAGYMMLHITIEISNKEAVLSRYTIPFGEGANLYTIDFEVDIKGALNNNIDTSGTIETRKWTELKPIFEHCVSAGQGILLSTKSNSLYCSVKQKEKTYYITGMSGSLSKSSSPLNIDWIYIEIQDNGKTVSYLTNLGKSHNLTLYSDGDGDYFLSDSGEYKKMPDILFFEEQAEKVIALEEKNKKLEAAIEQLKPYKIPKAFLELPILGNTTQQISDAIGGKEGFDNLVKAIKEQKLIIASSYDTILYDEENWLNSTVSARYYIDSEQKEVITFTLLSLPYYWRYVVKMKDGNFAGFQKMYSKLMLDNS